MAKRLILLSKDAFGKFYIPIYGNTFWKTPNIDDLASKGTVFQRHYTAAPSSSMSYYSMFTGQYPMESKMSTYRIISDSERFSSDTLFDKANKLGYECHIVWDAGWDTTAKLHSECYGAKTVFHSLIGIRQPTGIHAITGRSIVRNDTIAQETCQKIEDCIRDICLSEHDVFIWMHIPQVYNGRTGYGSDIDIHDWVVGMLRRNIGDDNIFITADHGNMNGSHGKLAYGFDVNEEASAIPLITPRIDGMTVVDFPTSNVDLFTLIFERKIVKREFVYSDSAYYAQLHRKFAIIHGRYKYIYSMTGRKEELYDVLFDPHEQQNLISDKMMDIDRGITVTINEMFFYPYWNDLDRERAIMRKELKNVWKNPSLREYIRATYERYGKTIKRKYNKIKKRFGKI